MKKTIIGDWLNLIYAKLDYLIVKTKRMENKMSVEFDALTAAVAKNHDTIESALVLIAGIKDRLDAAGVDPAKLAALSADLAAEDDKLASAVVANTPAESGPPTP